MSRRSFTTACLLCTLPFLLWTAWAASRSTTSAVPPSRPRTFERFVEPVHPAAELPEAPAASGEKEPPHLEPNPEFTLGPFPSEREAGGLAGLVLDARGQPLEHQAVRILSTTGPAWSHLRFDDGRGIELETLTGAEGRFAADNLPEGPYLIEATAEDGGSAHQETTVFREETTPVFLRLGGDGGSGSLRVLVRDRADHHIPDALVVLHGRARNRRNDAADSELQLEGRTDTDGEAAFELTDWTALLAMATTPEGDVGTKLLLGTEEIERTRMLGGLVIEASPAGSMDGVVTGAPLDAIEGGLVRASSRPQCAGYFAGFDPEQEVRVRKGAFAVRGLAAGTYELTFDLPGGWRPALAPGNLWESARPITVKVEAAKTSRVEIELIRGAAVTGRVSDAGGRPVPGASVRMVLVQAAGSDRVDSDTLQGVPVWRFDAPSAGWPEHPETHRRARTDGGGHYRLSGLGAGTWQIEIAAQGLSFDRILDLELAAGETRALEHHLSAAGAIQGTIGASAHLGIVPAQGEEPVAMAILPPTGLFTFAGIAPGTYRLKAFHTDSRILPVTLGEADVLAGRTTWVDLRRSGPLHVTARVLQGEDPREGISVWYGGRTETSGDGGRLDYPFSFPVASVVLVFADGLEWEYPERRSDAGSSDAGDIVLGTVTVNVQTLDADGNPARAELHVAGDGPPTVRGLVWTNAAGEARLPGFSKKGGAYNIMAIFADGSGAQAAIDPASGKVVVLQAPWVGAIKISVRDASGRALRGLCVTASSTTGEEPRTNIGGAWTDAHGETVLRGLEPGEVDLSLAEMLRDEAPPPLRVVVRPGETAAVTITAFVGRS